MLAVCTNDDVIHIYSVSEGKQTQQLKFTKYGVNQVSWDRRKKTELLCVVGEDIFRCDLTRNVLQKMLFSPRNRISRFARHPMNNRLCAVGCETGSVWLYDVETGQNQPLSRLFDGKVVDLGFDPKSEDYLLVATAGGVITLWSLDGKFSPSSTKKPTQLTEFAKQGSGLCACRFVDSMPGTFVTASDRHGVLRVWNVSNPNPQHAVKMDQGAVSSVAVARGAKSAGRIVVSFRSGEVAVVDVKARRQRWTSAGGHTETIFDCCFAPDDPNTVVTCSYDGTVRCWDARSRTCEKIFYTADARTRGLGGGDRTYEAGKGALYSCAVSCDGSVVCAAGFEGKLYFFDVETGRSFDPLAAHKGAVHRVVAHPMEAGVFAAASLDGTVSVFTTDGVRLKIAHDSPVQGCAFDPFRPDVIATATKAGRVEIHELIGDGGSRLAAKLEGAHGVHKVYGVKFSPLVPGKLMSVSDDKTARVWTVGPHGRPVAPVVTLAGHASNVRAQAWHPEIPRLCFTGSWDSTVRTWDANNGACLSVNDTHLADVYAIATHPLRPFQAVTCSRDTTIRFWSTEEMCPSAKLYAVVGEDVTRARAAAAGGDRGSDDDHDGPTLVGRAVGQNLAPRLEAARSLCERHAAAFVSLSGHPATEEMWRLAGIEADGPDAARAPGASGVTTPHRCEARGLASAATDALEAARATRAGSSAKEAALRAAASARLKLGDVRGYCDLAREIGDWDAALAAAPAVSLAFWAELAAARADALANDAEGNLDDVVHLRLAAGRVDDAVEALQDAGRDDDAFLVACTAAEGLLRAPRDDEMDAGARPCPASTPTRPPRPPRIESPTGNETGTGTGTTSAASTPARGHSRSSTLENVPDLAAALPSTLDRPRNSLPAIGATPGNKLAPLSPLPPLGGKTPLAPPRPVAGGVNPASPGARRDDSARGARAENGAAVENGAVALGRRPLDLPPRPVPVPVPVPVPASGSSLAPAGAAAIAVRATQGATRLAHGDAVGAASCALSVGDAVGAARALVRGAQIEMAAALMLSVPSAAGDASDAPRALLCERAAALGEWDAAFRSADTATDGPTRAWRLQLLAARRLAEGGDRVAAERFAEKCAAARGSASAGDDDAAAAVACAIRGDAATGAATAVTAAHAQIARDDAWDGTALERILSALAVVGTGTNATAYEPKLRAEVTLLRCFLSALALGSAGYTPAQHSLYHHARSALKSTKGESAFPRPVAYISLHQLAHMGEVYPGDAVEGLTEVAQAASVPAGVRDAAAEVAAGIVVSGETADKAPPPLAAMEQLPGYNGVVDWTAEERMPMRDALQAAAYWSAAGFVDRRVFAPATANRRR